MTDQEYKREFALLTEKLGRVPTPRDKEWLELSERLRKSYLPVEEETCSRREAHHSGVTNAAAINGASQTTQTATTVSPAEKPSLVMSAGRHGPMTTDAEPQRRRPVPEAESPAGGSPVPNARECPYDDPTCPCPDGDACHYVDLPGSPAWSAPGGAMSGLGIIREDDPDGTTGEAGNGAGNNYSVAMAVADLDGAGLVGARGPAGGIYAKCDGCGRVWEREKRRGRPSARCGECK